MKSIIDSVRSRLFPRKAFSSGHYWEERYRQGGNSGPGSYGELARFKAGVLNDFVREHAVASVIEFGCGDGNQLALAEYPQYTGYDVSPEALKMCRERFAGDQTKEFLAVADYDGRQADLALSLDVIFHLTEDEVFEDYMRRLFAAARNHVIIYSSDSDEPSNQAAAHVRPRKFTAWVARELHPAWTLRRTIPNAMPYNGDHRTTSFSDFHIFEKR